MLLRGLKLVTLWGEMSSVRGWGSQSLDGSGEDGELVCVTSCVEACSVRGDRRSLDGSDASSE